MILSFIFAEIRNVRTMRNSSGTYSIKWFCFTPLSIIDAQKPNFSHSLFCFPTWNAQCGWTSYVKQQTKHLGIALESDGNEACGGYSYGKMVEIWKAANATKSDLIGMWWFPDTTATQFVGSRSDLTRVSRVQRFALELVTCRRTHAGVWFAL